MEFLYLAYRNQIWSLPMRLFKVLSGVIVIIGILLVLTQNLEKVNINLIFSQYENVSLAIVIVLVMGIGILFGFAIALSSIVSSKAESRIYKSENKRLTDELNSLRNVAIDEGIYEVIEGDE